jgi:hypothetical protein
MEARTNMLSLTLADLESVEAARERGRAELALALAARSHPSVYAALMTTVEFHRAEAARHEYNSMMARLDADPTIALTL